MKNIKKQKKTLLIVDNDKDYIETICFFLSDHYIIHQAYSGHEAILKFSSLDIDLILLDLDLPKLNGIEVCRILKNLSQKRLIPIILMSGHSDSESLLIGYKSGADDYLIKPFNHQELLARCRSMFKIQNLQNRLLISETKLIKSHKELEKTVQQQIHEIEGVNRLKRYFSPSMVEKITKNQNAELFGEIPIRKVVTTFFTDIRNFTQFSDQLSPDDTKSILDHYIQFITNLAFKNKGTINKFLGDGILMVFGDPIFEKDHTLSALRAALSLKEHFSEFQDLVKNITKIPIQIGMGINTGPVIIGNVGYGEHLDYTVIGSAVNLAARLQSYSTNGEIIITQSSIEPYKNYIQSQNNQNVPIKGFQNPIAITEVIGLSLETKKKKIA